MKVISRALRKKTLCFSALCFDGYRTFSLDPYPDTNPTTYYVSKTVKTVKETQLFREKTLLWRTHVYVLYCTAKPGVDAD